MRTDKLSSASASTPHIVRPTPGPWHLNRAIRGRLYVEADGPVVICDMQLEACVPATRGITEADARLIAAAPELLDALIEARKAMNHHGIIGDPAQFMADAAIAKAEGKVTP